MDIGIDEFFGGGVDSAESMHRARDMRLAIHMARSLREALEPNLSSEEQRGGRRMCGKQGGCGTCVC